MFREPKKNARVGRKVLIAWKKNFSLSYSWKRAWNFRASWRGSSFAWRSSFYSSAFAGFSSDRYRLCIDTIIKELNMRNPISQGNKSKRICRVSMEGSWEWNSIRNEISEASLVVYHVSVSRSSTSRAERTNQAVRAVAKALISDSMAESMLLMLITLARRKLSRRLVLPKELFLFSPSAHSSVRRRRIQTC